MQNIKIRRIIVRSVLNPETTSSMKILHYPNVRFFLVLAMVSSALLYFGIKGQESVLRDFTLGVAFILNMGAIIFCLCASCKKTTDS